METTQATIDAVYVRQLDGGRSIYRTMAGDREYTTFKKEIAEAAKQLTGQEAEIGFTVKQNGQYTNYYLESATPARLNGAGGGGGNVGSEERELRIMRQSALARALESLPFFTEVERTRETIVTLTAEYLDFFQTGEWRGSAMTAAAPTDDIPF